MDYELTTSDPRYIECMRQFESGLAKIKYEFVKNLEERDILDQAALESLLNVYNQRLVIFQHDFLECLSRTMGVTAGTVKEFSFSAPDYDSVPEIAGGIIAGGGAAIMAAVIPVATAGHLWWTSSVVLAAKVGTVLGIGTGFATGGIGVLVGVAVAYAIKKYKEKNRKKDIREKLTKYFDNEITNSLREWAKNRIFEYGNMRS